MRDSGAKCIFTCLPLLETTLQVAAKIGLPKSRVYILEMPTQATEGKGNPAGFKTIDDLVAIGKSAAKVEKLKWGKGKGANTTAFLCYSSGTSGLPVRRAPRPSPLSAPAAQPTDIYLKTYRKAS